MISDDIKTYIANKISENLELKNKVKVKDQYTYGTPAKPPEILVDIIDMPEYVSATTFVGEKSATAMLQIIVMANEMSFNSVKYGAKKSCEILSNFVCEWFSALDVYESMPNILNTRRVQKTNSLPYENGDTTYYSILRFEMTVI